MPSFVLHPGFAGHSLRCNPWQPTQFLVTASEHFGVAGSGKVYVVNTSQGLQPHSPVQLVGCWGTSDAAFDACFSEVDRDLVAVACGDGVKLYSLQQSFNRDGVMPVAHSTEHRAEVVGVAWCRDAFLSCSWDGAVKLWKAATPQVSFMTFHEHLKEVYEVSCSTFNPASFLSCSGDGTWRLWDSRSPRSVLTQIGHGHQPILSIDFNKQDNSIFATGGVDRTVHLWDARRPQRPLTVLPGHDNACRRVRFSPHSRTLLASSGYDCRVCLWDLNQPQRPLTARYAHHREFVVGLQWSLATPNALASVSWDGSAFFWTNGQPLTPSPSSQPLPPAIPPPRVRPPRPKGVPDISPLPLTVPPVR
ncbi:peroxin 7, putative [Trypanosoma brucei gambiense DAL972]|uniref:Peroxin-7 n=2 Tax=Trypanosoma brucei TaxID=5691 RepID=C9ZL39_TRYB9|nr:peroxin 7, putative [Trypanosoma brucei gambiense DAL972]RHW73803.1 peroxisomal targeting signal 2 receptor [Trypanosoma brucei equiperdum]CBH10048.1 peroxin 7, putative [Trypanosoma brucei gambiense DAL972]|eukprot:XP_011772338.1 peroxin 7, putative [Trypanosoma brucei gambiense DAL972]